ncbi:MAG TPA: peptidyl-prolyl cis-trans isomerase [Terriglobales bacterium]|nr:peptidyl-prolyl cis-trans isomerase [Terriglobales bacterium]
MKKTYFLLIFSLCLLTISACQNSTKGKQGKILAKVDGEGLSEEGLNAELALAYDDSIPAGAKTEYLNRWIDNQLLYEEAKKRGLDKLPEVQIRAKQAAKDVIVLSLLNDQIAKNIQVSDDEARRFYDQNKDFFKRDQEEIRASHILFSSQAQADSASARLKKGENFEVLARKLSLDSLTRNSGGDIGYFSLSNTDSTVAKVASGLKIGMVSSPFKTVMGYHILKVTDRKPKGSIREFDEVKPLLVNQLLQNKRNQAISSLVEELQKKAKIEKFGWAADSQTTR